MGSVIIFFFYSLPVLLSSSVCVYIGTSPLSTIRRRHTQNTVVVSRTDVKNNKTKRRKKRFFKTDCGSVRGRCWHPAMGTKKTNTKQPATNCRQTDQPTDRPAGCPATTKSFREGRDYWTAYLIRRPKAFQEPRARTAVVCFR